MIVLGIDPGLKITGYGLVEKIKDELKLIEAGEIKSKPSMPLELRLLDLFSGIEDVAKEFNPDVFAIEELYSNYKFPKTAVIMGHARGVFHLVAGKRNIPVYSYSATRIKKAVTGHGHASKDQISKMVSNTIKCEEIKDKPDVSDAIAVAICHINSLCRGGLF